MAYFIQSVSQIMTPFVPRLLPLTVKDFAHNFLKKSFDILNTTFSLYLNTFLSISQNSRHQEIRTKFKYEHFFF